MTEAWPVRPPGTILLQQYLRERLARRPPGRFIEIGCGNGQMSRVLLEARWSGVGYDLNPRALAVARSFNSSFIDDQRFAVSQNDWLGVDDAEHFDLVFSCLVLEHLDDVDESHYFRKAAAVLSDGGFIAFFVPGSPAHWGIEDEVAGHLRRYDRDEVARRLGNCGLRATHVAGLTYPLSNLMLPLSNYLVGRHEAQKMQDSVKDRTIMSGHRQVPLKTEFPSWFKVFLNDVTIYPFHLLQKAFLWHTSALVLYVEATAS